MAEGIRKVHLQAVKEFALVKAAARLSRFFRRPLLLEKGFHLKLHGCFYHGFTRTISFAGYYVTEDEKDFDYVKGSKKGPEHWGELHKEWANCSSGRLQSPIDLLNERVVVLPHLGRLRRTCKPTKRTMKNRGHDIMLKWESGAGAMYINGTEFFLRQLHWHSPSEHTIDGRRYDMELHMVHQSQDNQTAVFGILYKIGCVHRHRHITSNIERAFLIFT